jgi:hypothetical protein
LHINLQGSDQPVEQRADADPESANTSIVPPSALWVQGRIDRPCAGVAGQSQQSIRAFEMTLILRDAAPTRAFELNLVFRAYHAGTKPPDRALINLSAPRMVRANAFRAPGHDRPMPTRCAAIFAGNSQIADRRRGNPGCRCQRAFQLGISLIIEPPCSADGGASPVQHVRQQIVGPNVIARGDPPHPGRHGFTGIWPWRQRE